MKLKHIVGKVRFCNNPVSKATGLMFSKKEDKALVFDFGREKKAGLHMLFVFYPIDLVFLGADKKVVEVKESFRPFAFYNSRKKSRYVIELPAGYVNKFKIKVNEKVEF